MGRGSKRHRLLAGRMDGGRGENVRQESVTIAAEQTGGDSRAPSFTTVIRFSRTAHHMGWHSLFIQSLALHIGPEEGRGWCMCVCECTEGLSNEKLNEQVRTRLPQGK